MRFILLTMAMIFSIIVTSCINDDFTDSPSAILTFPKDTVSFGTVFTDQGSPTLRFIVHNRNKKGVSISSIRFRNADTPFRLNVDGVNGDDFHDVEIAGRDSIYIFMECLVAATDSPEPFKVSDRLEFVTNGVTQAVEVEAMAQNVVRLSGMRIDSDYQITSRIPYIVTDSLVVGRDATLTVDPGARVMFRDGAGMIVRGSLHASGTADRKIYLCGDRIDEILPGVNYDIMSGQWDGIRITAESFDNRLEFVDMCSSSAGVRVDSCGDLSRQKLTLVNSWLHNSSSTVLSSEYSKVDAYGCCFSEAAMSVVSFKGGEHEFVHCTISNNYLFSAVIQPNLSLYHCTEDDRQSGNPLMKAFFENCIIWGLGEPLNRKNLTGSGIFFRNVLLRAEGRDDGNFVDCIWNEEPLFMTVREDYCFNYHVQPDSPAIGRGNPAYVNPLTQYDMDGIQRLSSPDYPPTLGAYAVE